MPRGSAWSPPLRSTARGSPGSAPYFAREAELDDPRIGGDVQFGAVEIDRGLGLERAHFGGDAPAVEQLALRVLQLDADIGDVLLVAGGVHHLARHQCEEHTSELHAH